MKPVISEIVAIPNGAPATLASLLASTYSTKVKFISLGPVGGPVALGPEGMVFATGAKIIDGSVVNVDVGTRAGDKEIEMAETWLAANVDDVTMNIWAWD